MSARRRLPNRRRSEVIAFDFGGLEYVASFSRFSSGEVGEVFLDLKGKGAVGSPLSAVARDLAVTASLCLQHGCSAETLRRALSRLSNGDAAGPLGMLLDMVDATHHE